MRPGLSSLKQMLKEEGPLLAESELKGKKEGRSSHQAQRKTMEKAACRRSLFLSLKKNIVAWLSSSLRAF